MGTAEAPTAMSGATEEARGLWSRPWTGQAVVCAATFLVYLNTLAFGFVFDDRSQIVRNPFIQTWGYVRDYFTSHVWADIYPGTVGNFYRPLFLLWLRLNHAAWGLTPQWWHLTSVICHVVAAYLVFRLAHSLTRDRDTALLAGLLFGLHPVHIESVAWVSGVTDTLMAVFFFASLCAYLAYRDGKQKRWLFAALACFALALLVKETAIVLLPLIVVCEWPGEPGANTSKRARAWRVAAVLVPFLAVATAYLVARHVALGGYMPLRPPVSWKTVMLAEPSVVLFYARHLVWPFGLCEFYPDPLMTRISVRAFLASLLLVLVVAAGVWRLVRWLRPSLSTRCAVALLVLPILPALFFPALNGRGTDGDSLHDRYLYLSSAGFAILVTIALKRLAELAGSRGKFIRWGMAGLLLTGYSVGTFAQQLQWANDRRLYTKGIESAPDNKTVRDNLAGTFLESGDYDRARLLYLDVLRRDASFWRTNYNLGFLYYKTGQYAEAEKYFTRAILIDPTDGDEFLNLAAVQLHQGKLDEAIGNARRAIQLKPRAYGYHAVLGALLKAKGLNTEAASELRLELMHNPGNVGAAQALKAIEQGK